MVEQGLYQEGKTFFEEANKIAKINNLNNIIAQSEMNLGNIYLILGMHENALEKYLKSLSITVNEDNLETLPQIYHNIANIYKHKEDFPKSIKYINKALDIINTTHNIFHKALFYLLKAELLCLTNDLSKSIALTTSAFSIFTEVGDKGSIADSYRILGKINHKKKKYDIALSYFENSLKINHQLNNLLNLGEVYLDLGFLYLDSKNKKAGKTSLVMALKYFRKFNQCHNIQKIEKILNKIN